jgi:hypothetical protein
MTEQEFLNKRYPFWLDPETLAIRFPTGMDRDDRLDKILSKYGVSWLITLRGYYIPDEYIMLYTMDYEIPNCNVSLIQYLLNYFPTIKWVGLGCTKGKPGEFWKPRMVFMRDSDNYEQLKME